MFVIEAAGLGKTYGRLRAVDNVSFAVEQGEIFGLLGPNGAGKTTTLEMLEGLVPPTAGSGTVLGRDIVRESRALRARIGVQLQATALPPLTKVREAVELFSALYPQGRAADEVIREFDLAEKANAYASDLSGGQMQRLSIALALVNDPEVVFLDEPTTGLDPQARLNLWTVIEGLRGRGKTMMLTTHYMEEAERLCDRIAVMDRGVVVALATPAQLIAEHAPGTTIEFDRVPGVDPAVFATIEGVDRSKASGRVLLHTTEPERVLRALLAPTPTWAPAGSDGEHSIRDLQVHQGTLEDVFIGITGRALRS